MSTSGHSRVQHLERRAVLDCADFLVVVVRLEMRRWRDSGIVYRKRKLLRLLCAKEDVNEAVVATEC